MAAAVAYRKRYATPLLDHVIPARHTSPCRGAGEREGGGGPGRERAGVLVEQMSTAADARSRASWILELIEGAVTKRAAAGGVSRAESAAALREENAALRARAEELERDNGVLMRGVAAQHRRQEELERGVAVLHRRQEEAERAAEEMKKKVAELVAANYGQLRPIQVFRRPDVFSLPRSRRDRSSLAVADLLVI